MTPNKFIKLLQAVQADGHGRLPVAVCLHTFDTGNGCWTICDVGSVEVEGVPQADDDGWVICNKDGTERVRTTVVVKGNN